MDTKVYAITDTLGYASDMRKAAADHLCEDSSSTEDLDTYISIEQIVNIVEDECLGLDDENRYLLNEDANAKIFDTITIWIHNVGMAKLAGQDLLECAWDNELNEMVFWAKNHEQSNQSGRSNMESKKSDS